MNALLKLTVSSPAAGYEYYTYIIIFFLYFLMQYLGLRSCISSIICYRLNTSARKKTSEESIVQGVVPLYAISGRSAKIFSDLVFCPNWGIYSRQLNDGDFLDNRY